MSEPAIDNVESAFCRGGIGDSVYLYGTVSRRPKRDFLNLSL